MAKPAVGPGDPVELEVTTVDQLGRPVPAELSIAMVDQSLLRLFNDSLPAIGPFFYDQTRTGAFATEATNTFRYAPATTAVAAGGGRGARTRWSPSWPTRSIAMRVVSEAQAERRRRTSATRSPCVPPGSTLSGRRRGARRCRWAGTAARCGWLEAGCGGMTGRAQLEKLYGKRVDSHRRKG